MRYLLTVSDYQTYRFAGPNRPSERSIRRWIQDGSLPGKKIGNQYYVDYDAEEKLIITGDPSFDFEMWKFLIKNDEQTKAALERNPDFRLKYARKRSSDV